MRFKGQNEALRDELREFVFRESFSEVGRIKEDFGLEFYLFDFGHEKFVVILLHQQGEYKGEVKTTLSIN